MKWKERIINTITGKPVDFLPFIPRLDVWYQSNKLNNTLPPEYKNLTLKEIAEEMDVGLHTIVPDFRNFLEPDSIALLGLGIYDLKSNPYKIIIDSIDFKCTTNERGLTTTVFKTPYGNITTKVLYTEKMRRDGATVGRILEYALKSIDDFKAIGYIFEKIAIDENYKNFLDHKEYIGDEGVCVAFCSLSSSPMHHIMRDLISFEKFVFELYDNPKELENLAEKIKSYLDKVLKISTESEADIVFLGANYDSFLTWPAFFTKYITPYLKTSSDYVHKNNKFFLTHTDGENTGLLQEYINADIDIADSICPYPMTKLKIEEVRKKFNSKISIWGGIPSICVLEESMSDLEFDKFINNFFENIEKGDHLILSFADTTPPGASLERIKKVFDLSKKFELKN